MSPINGSDASGSGSAENLSSSSNNQTSSASRGNTSNIASNSNTITVTENFKPFALTESLLNRHNEDMQKLMMQKHRKLRPSIKNSDKLKDARIKTKKINDPDQSSHYVSQGHGVKRSGTPHSWKDDNFKVRVLYLEI
jgi:period circadian protein